jgi:glycosyltransferase involved in cell wall biosynthesis
MNEPLISIVVPIYNPGLYLVKCIESLINQTYRNIQIILVNDGSQDGSQDICKKFKELDSRVFVIDQQNQGVSKARSAGIEAAVGEYIGFVDSDDFVDLEMYQVLLSKIRAEESECVTLVNFTIKPPCKNILDVGRPIDNIEAIGELFL